MKKRSTQMGPETVSKCQHGFALHSGRNGFRAKVKSWDEKQKAERQLTWWTDFSHTAVYPHVARILAWANRPSSV
jgi:hypothetical protein